MSDEPSPAAEAGETGVRLPSPHVIDVQMRFRDTDRLGHVNNATIATYAELGRLEFLMAAGAVVTSVILARLAIDYKAQILMHQHVQVATEVVRIGSSSITLHQQVTADGELAADIESVLVCFDYEAQRPVRVPDSLRQLLQPKPA